ncbi:ExbD/TolR family protein [Perlucidibaca piscinae]|uniref:ExbD/TolR family protein n=1 Tax=Perlucidibaca piscinae TaxID=392589 RepID=UPI0003B45F5C|nr:biopolymer transporter ExbD [Perlucidibaca piscinae]
MAFGSFEQGDEIEANAEINMIPFIDIMLVLLIIFMITAPLMSHAVKVDLPKASSQPLLIKTKPVEIAVLADGGIRVNGNPVPAEGLAAALAPFPDDSEVHLRADRKTPYEAVARVLSATSESGLSKVGFVTEQLD